MSNMIDIIKQLKSIQHSSYNDLKLKFTYHSNRLAGSSFTLHQLTALMLDDQVEGPLYFADMISNQNSLILFDFITDTLGHKLTKELLAEYYHILVRDQEVQAYINVEDRELLEVLTWFNNLKTATLRDIAEFHYAWMCNRTFCDESGRIGRLILLKQCLENDIVPFVIREEDVEEYNKVLEQHVENLQEFFEGCEKFGI